MRKRSLPRIIGPLSVGLIFSLVYTLVYSFSPIGKADGKLYDLLSSYVPIVAPSRELLVLVDDGLAAKEAAAFRGSPASSPNAEGFASLEPDFLTEILLALTEAEAGALILDLSVDTAGSAPPPPRREELSARFDREFGLIEGNIETLFSAIRAGSVHPKDSRRYVSELIGLVEGGKKRLIEAASGSGRGAELRLTRAAGLFGELYITLPLIESGDSRGPSSVGKSTGTPRVETADSLGGTRPGEVASANGFEMPRAYALLGARPPTGNLLPDSTLFASVARGGGYSGALVEPEGVIRRFLPAVMGGSGFFASTALRALADRHGYPELRYEAERIVLSGVRPSPSMAAASSVSGTVSSDGTIELSARIAPDGTVLLPRRRLGGEGGFRSLSLGEILLYARLERELYAALKGMETAGYLVDRAATARAEYAEELLSDMLAGLPIGTEASKAAVAKRRAPAGESAAVSSGTGAVAPATVAAPAKLPEWREVKAKYFSEAEAFLSGPAEKDLLAGYDRLIAEALSESGKASLLALRTAVISSFAEARKTFAEAKAQRKRVFGELTQAICVIASTSEAALADAAFLDGMLSERFPFALQSWAALGLVGLFLVCAVLILECLSPLWAVFAAIAATALGAGSAALLFIYAGIWLSPIFAGGAVAVAGTVSALLAVAARRDERLLRERAARNTPQLRGLGAAELARIASVSAGGFGEASFLTIRARGLAAFGAAAASGGAASGASGAAVRATGEVSGEAAPARENGAAVSSIATGHGGLGAEGEAKAKAAALVAYHEAVCDIVRGRGGLVVSVESEVVSIAFGSPLGGAGGGGIGGGTGDAAAACSAALEILETKAHLDRRFAGLGMLAVPWTLRAGLDRGEALFGGFGAGGPGLVAATGPALERSRLLAGLAARHGRLLLAAEPIARAATNFEFLPVDRFPLVGKAGEESYYELKESTAALAAETATD